MYAPRASVDHVSDGDECELRRDSLTWEDPNQEHWDEDQGQMSSRSCYGTTSQEETSSVHHTVAPTEEEEQQPGKSFYAMMEPRETFGGSEDESKAGSMEPESFIIPPIEAPAMLSTWEAGGREYKQQGASWSENTIFHGKKEGSTTGEATRDEKAEG